MLLLKKENYSALFVALFVWVVVQRANFVLSGEGFGDA